MSETEDADDARLTERARTTFERSVEALDAPTRSRLSRARARALREASAGARARTLAPRTWLGVAAAAAAALAVVMVLQRPPAPALMPMGTAALEDLELLLGEDELEMLEDLDFYAWLEEQPEISPPASAGDGVG